MLIILLFGLGDNLQLPLKAFKCYLLGQVLREFGCSKEFSDIVFNTSEGLIYAHKIILATRAKGFKKWFSKVKEKDSEGRPLAQLKPGINPSVFKRFILFLYTDTITIDVNELPALKYISKKCSIPDIILRLNKNGNSMILLESTPDFSPAYELVEYADVYFIVKDNTFPAHKIILCAKSDYFVRMFRSGLMESTQKEIPMADVSIQAFTLLLNAIYVNNFRLPTVVTEDGQLLIELLQFSALYGIQNIKIEVEAALSSALHVDCAVSLLLYAELYESPVLSESCKIFIAKNYTTISETFEYAQLSSTIKMEIKQKKSSI